MARSSLSLALLSLSLLATVQAFNVTVVVGKDQVTGLPGVGFDPSRCVSGAQSRAGEGARLMHCLTHACRTVTVAGDLVVFHMIQGECPPFPSQQRRADPTPTCSPTSRAAPTPLLPALSRVGPHHIVETSFNAPCSPIGEFDSGLVNVANGTVGVTEGPAFVFPITNSSEVH